MTRNIIIMLSALNLIGLMDLPLILKGRILSLSHLGLVERMCPGILFGTANVELPLTQLLYCFDWKLLNGIKPNELDMAETRGVIAARKNELHLLANPYIEEELAYGIRKPIETQKISEAAKTYVIEEEEDILFEKN